MFSTFDTLLLLCCRRSGLARASSLIFSPPALFILSSGFLVLKTRIVILVALAITPCQGSQFHNNILSTSQSPLRTFPLLLSTRVRELVVKEHHITIRLPPALSFSEFGGTVLHDGNTCTDESSYEAAAWCHQRGSAKKFGKCQEQTEW